MTNRFFDENSFQHAVDLLETAPFHSVLELKDYTSRYPKDYYGRIYYALALTRICEFEEAENEYEIVRLKSQNDSFYNSGRKDLTGFKYYMLIVKLKILAHEKKYKEIYDLSEANKDLFESPSDFKYISYYCRIKLGLLEGEIIDTDSYRFKQAYNYSEELFREHLKRHIKKYNEDLIQPNDYLFENDFPIDKIIDEVKKLIPLKRKTSPGYFDDTYFFKYDYCGKVKEQWTNTFTVVCFQDTKDIITMCPVIGYDKIPAKDINNLRYELIDEETKDEPKVKKLSQIDKFNQRFKRG